MPKQTSAKWRSLRRRWYTLRDNMKLADEWLVFDNFYEDLEETFTPGAYLTAIDPKRPHSRGNSYWADSKPGTGGRPAKNRQGLRRGRLKFLHPWPAPHWLAVCDCGRLRTFSQDMTNRAVACGVCAHVHGSDKAWYTALTQRDWLVLRIAHWTQHHFTRTTWPTVEPRTQADVPAEPPDNCAGMVENMTLQGLDKPSEQEQREIWSRQHGVTFK